MEAKGHLINLPGGLSCLLSNLDDIHDFLLEHGLNPETSNYHIDQNGFHIFIEDEHVAILFKLKFC